MIMTKVKASLKYLLLRSSLKLCIWSLCANQQEDIGYAIHTCTISQLWILLFIQSTHISVLPVEVIRYILCWVISAECDMRSLELFGQVSYLGYSVRCV